MLSNISLYLSLTLSLTHFIYQEEIFNIYEYPPQATKNVQIGPKQTIHLNISINWAIT